MADVGKNGSMQSVSGSKNPIYDNADNIKFEEGNCWHRRSSLEKKLIVLLVVLFLAFLILFIVILVLAPQINPIKSEGKTEPLNQPDPSKPVVTTEPSSPPDTTQPEVTTMPSTKPDTTQPEVTTIISTKPDTTQPEVTTEPPSTSDPEICVTPGCVQTAARILDRADWTVDPCVDFYEYACGSWMRKNIISEERSSNNIFTLLTDSLNIQLKALMEAPAKDGEANSIGEVRDLYQSCLDLDTIDSRGSKPLLDTLPEFGGWPILDPNWNETTFSLETLLSKLSTNNQVPVIRFLINTDIANSSIYKIYFDQASLGMPSRNYYLRGRNDTTLMAYQNYITRIGAALGADPEDAKTQAEEMVDFEIQLANITVPPEERFDQKKLYNLMTLAEMSQNYPEFDWLGYTQSVMSIDGVGINITADEVIVNWSPPYFEKLFPILEATPKKVQANYIMWMLIKERVKLLDITFRDIIQDYSKVLTGVTAEPPRWKICLTYVNTVMMMATARLYTDAHFDEIAKSTMLELISFLRGAFDELLEEADWMDDATRAVAKEKASFMKEKIGYPDAIKNNSYIDELYAKENFSADLYFENVVLDHQLSSINHLKRLRKSVDKTKWLIAPALVNAFYHPSWNEIVFPEGILQLPFYSEDQPWSINFGGIGSVIGHEITHGFDNSGRQRDKDGNLRQWWADDVIERFDNETQCFIEQASSFLVPEAKLNVNGKLTLGEDVADNGGVKQAYRAYRKWVVRRGKEEPLLPGVTLNNNQLFFMSWAQIWCAKIRPATAVRYIYIDYHSPNRYRAFAPLMNLPEFAEAFKCTKGSSMNPEKQCTIW